MKYQTIEIEDVLSDGQGVVVGGMTFDCLYSVWVKKTGDHPSDLEIESHEHGPITIVTGGYHLALDQDQLKGGLRSLYNQIITALEVAALKKAANIPDTKWKHEEYAE